MTSPLADNVLCAVFANESGQQLSILGLFGDCNFRSVTLVTLCTFKRKRENIYDNHFHLTNFYF